MLTADDVRGLAFKSTLTGEGADRKGKTYLIIYAAKEHPAITMIVSGYTGSEHVDRKYYVHEEAFDDGDFQGVADAYNALKTPKEKSDA